ncbi:MAG: gas vesicle protein [Chloroflexi bacterium]|nr:gas vesicle protein [Chloroflexota bacterium]
MQQQRVVTYSGAASLPDVLERILDKGVVIAGDITVLIGSVELLTIRIRLLVASVDTAVKMGIDWWKTDPLLSSRARQLEAENRLLRERLDRAEAAAAPVPGP